MPRPRRDGSAARIEANKRRLSDAFVKTVRADPDRVIVYWDTLQHGLALAVQPSGHLAWKCVYTIHGRGSVGFNRQRRFDIAVLRPAKWPAGSRFRSPGARIRMPIGWRSGAGGRSRRWPPAMSRSTPARGIRVLAASRCAGLEISAAAVGESGYWQYPTSGRQGHDRGHHSTRRGEPGARRSGCGLQLGGPAGDHFRQSLLRRRAEQHDEPRADTW